MTSLSDGARLHRLHVFAIIHDYVNDDMIVNAWQDGIVTEQDSTPSAVPEQAVINTIDQLKALADPTRLAILETLMGSGPAPLPVMSVKELAAALREPQTKLYRHVKVLEAAGLIRVAATRMVSGIAEQRYQACQRDLDFAANLLRQNVDDAEALMRAVFDQFRNAFLAVRRARPPDGNDADDTSLPTTLLIYASGRRAPAEVATIRTSLSDAVAAHFDGDDSGDPESVPMHVLVSYFLDADSETG
jgi:DNA-binding transcriptional ArsR family regulator